MSVLCPRARAHRTSQRRPSAHAPPTDHALTHVNPDAAKLTDAGAPPAALEAWFERTLHGALTLATVGEFRPFREVARAALQTTLAQLELNVAKAEEILGGLSEVQPHDDAAAALDRLAGEHARIVALTNSGGQQTEETLDQSCATASNGSSASPTSAPTSPIAGRMRTCSTS